MRKAVINFINPERLFNPCTRQTRQIFQTFSPYPWKLTPVNAGTGFQGYGYGLLVAIPKYEFFERPT